MRFSLTLVSVIILLQIIHVQPKRRKQQKTRMKRGFDLSRHLRRIGYDRSLPPSISTPGGQPSEATEVKIGIYINNFYSISEISEEYSLNIYLRQTWNDPRLQFDGSDQNNKTSMIKLGDGAWNMIWVPDIFFRNEKHASFHHMTTPNRLMRLWSDGTVWYASKVSVTLSCTMGLMKYPLDTQRCPMMFESFGYTMDVIYLKWLKEAVKIPSGKDKMPTYHMTKHETKDCSQNYTTGAYPCLQINFYLKRDAGYYIIQVYIPSMMIVILSWVSYWINIDAAPARVSLGLLTVLTMTTQSATARSNLPRVSYIKAIDVWMTTCLLFVFASLLEFAIVNVYSRKVMVKSHLRHSLHNLLSKKEENVNNKDATEAGKNNDIEAGSKTKQIEEYVSDPEGRRMASKIDKVSRKGFPLVFLAFNAIYWAVYTQMDDVLVEE